MIIQLILLIPFALFKRVVEPSLAKFYASRVRPSIENICDSVPLLSFFVRVATAILSTSLWLLTSLLRSQHREPQRLSPVVMSILSGDVSDLKRIMS